jgi:hypothetical protein
MIETQGRSAVGFAGEQWTSSAAFRIPASSPRSTTRLLPAVEPRTPARRRIAVIRRWTVVGGLAILLPLVACGDDDDDRTASPTTAEETTTSSEDALCSAVDDLEQDIGALGDLDVVADGTDAVEASLSAIREDLAEIRDQAPDTAPEEADAFDSALTSLDDAIAAVGDGTLTAESARDLITAVASTVTAGQSYLGALDDACP